MLNVPCDSPTGAGSGYCAMQTEQWLLREKDRVCYGRIDDLQTHLKGDWWRRLFDSVYLKTDRDVLDNQENTRADVDLIERTTHLKREHRILDLCCGQGRHCIEFARRGFRSVAGLDQSRFLVWLARRRSRREGLNIGFEQGDIRTFRPSPGSFDCVTILGNSFGYFEDSEDDAAVLGAVREMLSENGVFVLDIPDGAWVRENFEPRSWEWVGDHQFVCRERTLNRDASRLIAREIVTDTGRGVVRDQFYSERLYSREEIRKLVIEAGFASIQFHDDWNTLSDRKGDLGLMENRIFLTARA